MASSQASPSFLWPSRLTVGCVQLISLLKQPRAFGVKIMSRNSKPMNFLKQIIVLKLMTTFICGQKVRNVKLLPVDVDALNNGLSSLLLPSQKV
ncbi:hypothetical protein V2J09_006256 [Rumex salicifolius]